MIYSNGKIVNIYKGDTPIKKVVKGTDLVWQKVIPISEIIVFEGNNYGQSLPLKSLNTYKFVWDTSKYNKPIEIGYGTKGDIKITKINNNDTFKIPADCDLVFIFNQVSLKIYEIANGGAVRL